LQILELSARANTLVDEVERLLPTALAQLETENKQRAAAEAKAREVLESERVRAAEAQRLAEEERAAAEKVAAERMAEQKRLAAERAAEAKKQAEQAAAAATKKAAEEKAALLQAEEAKKQSEAKAAALAKELVEAKRAEALKASEPPPLAGLMKSNNFTFGVVNEVWSLDLFQALLAKSGDSVVLVDFMAPWCRPCVGFAPTLKTLAGQFNDVLFLKVDCDAVPDVATTCSIRAFPTFHTYFRGKLHQSFSGASEPKVREALSTVMVHADDILTNEAIAESMRADASAPRPVAPTSGGAGATAPSTGISLEDELLQVAMRFSHDGSIQVLVQSQLEELCSSCSKDEANAALDTLQQLVHNIQNSPSEAKFRSIKKGNASFQSKFGKHGAKSEAVLRTIGYTSETRSEGDTWTFLGDVVPGNPAATRLADALKAITNTRADLAAIQDPRRKYARSPVASSHPGPAAAPPSDEDDAELQAALALSMTS
jgi:thiol-disulfide isomerase/thioredoxin